MSNVIPAGGSNQIIRTPSRTDSQTASAGELSPSPPTATPPTTHPSEGPKKRLTSKFQKLVSALTPKMSDNQGEGRPSSPPERHTITRPYGALEDNSLRRPQMSRSVSTLSTSSVVSTASTRTDMTIPGKRTTGDETYDRLDDFFTKRKDLEGLVRMKLKNVDYPQGASNIGVDKSTFTIAAKYYSKYADNMGNPKILGYQIASPGEDGTWNATSVGGTPEKVTDGTYIFVTMADGTIRIGAKIDGSNAHSKLSSFAAYVKYAGQIEFENGKPKNGSPQSGSYAPPLEQWTQSGFSESVLDKKIDIEKLQTTQDLYRQTRRPPTPQADEVNSSAS